ncbi:hypothetical protein [Corallococcus sicarius]|uniref:Uncharacterized protein n=1 Tax=Corallococcus sicarius TaxID=2316726 RepID=A0A3A8N7W7_9BACT|nr:hypothetical protein [Corallococcus sicarius]RKH39540.1 hypothetical protein D7X12_23310 [Corallococcus sicarius]
MGQGRAHSVGMWLFVLGCVTACPEVHRRGGLVDRAAHRDAVEQVPEDRCPPKDYALYCEGEDDQSAECLEKCP